MAFDRWTSKPRVPVMLKMAAAAPLLLIAPACDSDEGETGEETQASTSDTFPTAGACAHGADDCEPGTTTDATATATATTSDETTTPGSTTDVFPTPSECAHGGVGCGTSTGADTDGGSGSGSGSGSESGSGSGSGSGSTGGTTTSE